MNDRGDTSVRRHPFEGVLHNMERRYKEIESSAVRVRSCRSSLAIALHVL